MVDLRGGTAGAGGIEDVVSWGTTGLGWALFGEDVSLGEDCGGKTKAPLVAGAARWKMRLTESGRTGKTDQQSGYRIPVAASRGERRGCRGGGACEEEEEEECFMRGNSGGGVDLGKRRADGVADSSARFIFRRLDGPTSPR